jgi:hypothetical protein
LNHSYFVRRSRFALLLLGLVAACGREVPAPKIPTSSGEDEGPMLPLASDVEGDPNADEPPEAEVSPEAAEAAALAQALEGQVPGGILAPGQADKLLAPGAPPSLELLGAGQDPQEALRYAVAKPGSEKLEMSLEMSIDQGAAAQMRQPPVRIEFEVKRAAPNQAGDAPVTVSVKKADVSMKDVPKDDPAMGAMAEALAAAKTLVIRYELTPRGMHKNVDVSLANDTKPLHAAIAMGVAQAYRATMTLLPEEPVGAGATWRVISRHQEAGSDLLQIATYELRERKGTELTLDVKTRQLAATPDVAAPVAGMTMRLISLDSGGTAVHGINLGEASPMTGRSENISKMTFEMTQGGRTQRGAVANDIAIAFGRSLGGG